MRTLVLFLEERSAMVLLEGLLSRVLPPGVVLRFIVFEGKQDLEKRLESRLRSWQEKDALFLVLRDQDSGDCGAIKSRLAGICSRAGRPGTTVRIACRALESWYLGDLSAVERALDVKGICRHASSAKFRNPDRLGNPDVELKKLTRGAYQKISGSRALGRELSLSDNASRSFQVFLEALRRLFPATEGAQG